ncbi:MAG: transporter [bacterium]
MKIFFYSDSIRGFLDRLKNWFLPGQSVARVIPLLILLYTTLGAFGAERSGSTFTPGTLGDFGVAVVSTNAGLYLRNDMFYYQGTDARTMRNGQINIDLNQAAWVESLKLILVPGWTVLGARYAAGVNLGLVSAHVQSDVLQPDPSGKIQAQYIAGNRTTISDVFVTPVVLSWKLGPVHVAWAEMVSIPSGTYNNEEFVNISRNYWALDSQLALTWIHPQTGLELSGKGGFIVNSRNEDTDYRTGNELHVEGLVAKRLDKRFSLGAVWYYYDQVSADTGSGTLLGEFEGQAFGAGPALRYIIPFESRNLTLIAKWIHEFYTRDRFAGDYIYFCFATRL